MTEIERRALALVNGVAARLGITELYEAYPHELINALIRVIEQHEAFRQEVSDAVEDYCGYVPPDSPSHPITRFIIAKPDPLLEVCDELGLGRSVSAADDIRAALATRGLKIVEDK